MLFYHELMANALELIYIALYLLVYNIHIRIISFNLIKYQLINPFFLFYKMVICVYYEKLYVVKITYLNTIFFMCACNSILYICVYICNTNTDKCK